MTDRAAAVSLFLAVTLAVLMFAPRQTTPRTAPDPLPVPAGEGRLGAPLGTSRIIPTADPLDGEPPEAGDERRSSASGAPPATISDRGRVTASGLDEEAGAGLDDRTVQGLGGSSPVDPPALTSPPTAVTLTGIASWFCRPPSSVCTRGFPASGQYAAAGPALRVPGWRGSFVYVTHGARSIRVQLVDHCQCMSGTTSVRVLDLYAGVFAELAPLSRGLLHVVVSDLPGVR